MRTDAEIVYEAINKYRDETFFKNEAVINDCLPLMPRERIIAALKQLEQEVKIFGWPIP